MPSFNSFTNLAVEAALEAGNILKRYYGKSFQISYKGERNPVTQADLESERLIKDIIAQRFPRHEILAEETYHSNPKDYLDYQGYLWLVDPLDGTVNFKRGIPVFAVSIALMYRGRVVSGVVYAPILDELFLAEERSGAYFNDRQIWVSDTVTLDRAVLATGFPYDLAVEPDLHVARFERFCLATEAIRRLGAAALDMAYVAAGRLDGFWEAKLSPWDTAAGWLLVLEAGGKVTDYEGNEFNPFMKSVVASNGKIHEAMLEVIRCP